MTPPMHSRYVALAILAMSLTRSLHPPSAAMALTAALIGPAGTSTGWFFPLMPVLANSLLVVALGLVFHRLRGHAYPHYAPHPTPERRTGIESDDIDAALARIEQGTYGYSAISGMPIPRERLEAIPETTVLAAEKVSGVGPR